MVLQCSGNGRSYFPSKPVSGTPWADRRRRLRALERRAGALCRARRSAASRRRHAVPHRHRRREGPRRRRSACRSMVERSVAIAARWSDALLAWEMNGVPITLAHGGPLRLIVPGYNGVNNVKYVKRVAFTEAESQAKIMSTGYRMTALGGTSKSSDPSIQELTSSRSLDRTRPAIGRSPRRHGLGHRRRLQRRARRSAASRCRATAAGPGSRPGFFGPDLGRFAWRQFAMPLRMSGGRGTCW